MKVKILCYLVLTILFLISTVSGITFSSNLNNQPPRARDFYFANTGTQTGRLSRNGIPSTCSSLKANPGLFSAIGDRRYDQYRFVALTSGCVSVTIRDAGNSAVFAAAYNENGLNPTDPDANYLADPGNSPTTSTPLTFAFNVTVGQVFHIVVHELNPDGTVGQNYSLDIIGVKLTPEFSVSEILDTTLPEPNPETTLVTSGQQTGRITRFSPPSSCDSPKPNPGLFSTTGARRADLYRFMPANSGCAIVSLAHTGPDQAHVVVYDQNGFLPSDPSQNYLADSAVSANETTRVFSFMVQRGVPFDIVVHEIGAGAGAGANYKLDIGNVKLAPEIEFSGQLDPSAPTILPDYTSSTGTQTGRHSFPLDQPPTCATPNSNPGLLATGSRRFDRYTFTPATSGCVEVTFFRSGLMFASVYDNSGFNPADPSQNRVADLRSGDLTFSFKVTAGLPFTIVVYEFNPGGAENADYRLKIRGVSLNVAPRADPFDLDGDSRTDVGIFRPGPGEWWYLRSIDNVANAFQFGQGTDTIAPADFTGDGLIDVAFFRPSTGFWFVLRSEDNSFFSFPFGTNGDIPVPGDYDGDGKADPAVFRPSSATWFINNSGGGQTIRQFGLNGDIPLSGDFDGDLRNDFAVYRPTVAEWYYERSNEGDVIGFQFGGFGDTPIPADFTGDGKTDIAFFTASNEWFVLRSEDTSFFAFPFGANGDIPVPGDYDGDGTADAAVFRPSNNTWFLQQSTEGFEAIGFGINGDVPIPSAYIP